MAHVGAVQRHGAGGAAHGQRRPRRQAEVRVYDIEALPAEAPAQLARGGEVAAGREGEDLEVHTRQPAQRVDLVAHEAAAGGIGRRGPHVRHDERAHRCLILHGLRGAP
jgi:hypothetical protein